MFWYASYIRTIKNYITYAELILYKSAGARSDVGGPPDTKTEQVCKDKLVGV